jgi:hypothetical protein
MTGGCMTGSCMTGSFMPSNQMRKLFERLNLSAAF